MSGTRECDLRCRCSTVFYGIPEDEREHRCVLQSDTCVIDDKLFFVRGCIEIPVDGANEPFIWRVGVSQCAEL
jgi:hypothetical protein